MKPSKLFDDFFHSEKAGGLILIFCTIISLVLANSVFGKSYIHLFETELSGSTIEHWINDGLMAIFFLLIGLELKREFVAGELSNIKNALLPAFGALGGMLVPAGIYLLLNFRTSTQGGAGIPMATDIAFAIGVLSLLGNKIPTSLKVFLTALAVIDDLGAIVVIALFYSKTIYWSYLIASLGIFLALLILNRLKVNKLFIYLLGGFFMWYFMLHSGIHATIAGVLLAFVIPHDYSPETSSPAEFLEEILHKPVAFLIMPIFALANTAFIIDVSITNLFKETYAMGICLGLIIGKPLGIFIFSFIGVKLKFCDLGEGMNWLSVIGVGLLGGIGFTMSIFIALLAFDDFTLISNSKLAILSSSLVAGGLGYLFLHIGAKINSKKDNEIANSN
ncbi:MAG: Na+/H+ antiporter NhaA [Bacteroidota bacterium]